MIHRPGEIDEIDDQIMIGDAESYKSAREHKVRSILNVCKEVDYEPPAGVDYRKIPLTDDENNSCDQIQEAIDTLADLVEKGGKILVHCRAGVSRSPSIVAAYYAQYEGWTMDSALAAVKNRRNIANPRPELWASILLCSMQRIYA